MKKHVFIFCLAIILVIAGLLVASNMGFKLTYTLAKSAGVTGTNWVSLPYYWSGTLSTDVCTDATNATEVGHYLEGSDNFESHSCPLGKGQVAFDLTPGEGVFVKVDTDASDWVIVGSHNPSTVLTLAKSAGVTGTNWVSVPYHTTATLSTDSCTEITNATEVGHYLEASDNFESHSCPLGKGQVAFDITTGEGVFIKVDTDATSWTPAHY